MEHKLILGGEHWLPFARSRLKALEHLVYASQKIQMPDGAEVEVRVANGQEFIRITGTEVVLEMDSGAIGIANIAPEHPGRYWPGVMHEAGPAKAYNASFIKDSGDGRTNPAKGSAGQLSGVLTYRGGFKGKIRDNPRSFYPELIKRDDEFVPSPADDLLHAKKVVGILCPASIFTGKCRLYVQAMYGLPLYEYNGAREVVHINSPLGFISQTGSAPELYLPPFRKPGDSAHYPTMLLNTSCGVWLDEKTGRHWLFKPGNDTVWVAPLRARADVEKLRSWLVPTGSEKDLSEEDREHLEAYILAYSLPDHGSAQDTEAGAVSASQGGGSAIAYGWKWKWSGPRAVADIVNVIDVPQDARNAAMSSTHFRIELEMLPGDGPVRWKSVFSVVEGPVSWAVYRNVWTITRPNFATGLLEKFTPPVSIQFPCDAPYYCFYLRNELQVCRVTVTYSPADEPTRVMSDGYADPAHAGPITYRTLGLLDGFHRDSRGLEEYFSAKFKCGMLSSPLLFNARTEEGWSTVLQNKNLFAVIFMGIEIFQHFWQSYPVGYPPYSYTAPVFGRYREYSGLLTYDFTSSDFHEERNSLATLVVPFYDAEAIYLHYSKSRYLREQVLEEKWSANVAGHRYVHEYRVYSFETELARYRTYNWAIGRGASGAELLSVNAFERIDSAVEEAGEFLICHAGVLPATFTHLDQFHDNSMDSVSAQFGTISGTSVDEPTVISPGYTSPVGADEAPGASVIVGWV